MGGNRGSYLVSTLGPVAVAPSSPLTATMLVTLPWTPQRASLIKINSAESVIGKSFTVTIDEMGYGGTLVDGQTFWEDPMGAGLTIYHISDTNEIVVDQKGNCPVIDTIKLKIDGVDVPITPKA